jgi:hypothetical protein
VTVCRVFVKARHVFSALSSIAVTGLPSSQVAEVGSHPVAAVWLTEYPALNYAGEVLRFRAGVGSSSSEKLVGPKSGGEREAVVEPGCLEGEVLGRRARRRARP